MSSEDEFSFDDDEFQKIANEVKALKKDSKSSLSSGIGITPPKKEQVLGLDLDEDKLDDVSTLDKAEMKEEIKDEAPRTNDINNNYSGCIFCKIVKGEVPSRKVFENNDFLGFLDIQPKAVGHVVLVSKRHVTHMIELDVAEHSALDDAIREICRRMRERLQATGYTILSSNGASAGQTVPHFSMHIIPTYSTNSVELPLMNLIQPQKVPPFIMKSVEMALSKENISFR